MRQLAVVAYPRLNEADIGWLESIRRQHDPQAELVPAHFTLMFPLIATVESLIAHANRCAAECQAFDILITQAKPHRTTTNGASYVFVLPALGSKQIIAIHDRLYGDDFRGHLRHNLSYQPHMTVARKNEYAECISLASSMNDKGMHMPGRIDSITVLSIGPSEIISIAEFRLGCAVTAT